MSRGLWFVAGAGAGVYAMVRGRRAAEALSVDGLRDRVSGVAHGARLFRDEVAQGSATKETELRERYGLVPHGPTELASGRHRAAVVEQGSTTTGPTTPGHDDEEGST